MTEVVRPDPLGAPASAASSTVGPGRPPITRTALELSWIPLGAGTRIVRTSGRVYESLTALFELRPRCPLFHTALVARVGAAHTIIEMAPIPNAAGPAERGVVAEGAVGTRLLRRFRTFRYEVRRWPGGVIPDLQFAIASPVLISDDPAAIQHVLDLVPLVPTPVWGRDGSRAGEMWNSNSVTAWLLARAGLLERAGRPPDRGRAPGWDAGVRVAERTQP